MYAGTGNLGIEALSRGALSAVFVDKSPDCIKIIKYNLIHTKLIDKAVILNCEAENALRKMSDETKKFDIIFIDPPYNKVLVKETLNYLIINDIMKKEGMIVTEHDTDDLVPEKVGNIRLIRSQKYGGTVLSFYQKAIGGRNL